MNKKKVINDPIYGFITIPGELIFDIIEHPYFQRLRRIRQLGLADFTYPGALHTRFHHALGAMHLMGQALMNLRSKGHDISDKEMEAAQAGVLLHDIGHGPFSHALEHTLLSHTTHEQLSVHIFEELNKEFNNALDMAIQMFNGTYPRNFFHQLISSQLDIDRLDYLQRDCFFTGVSEGTIGADRIIKMLEISNDELVVEEKGIYSIENFLNARRLMYWQVYLHKVVVSTEKMIIQIIKRARDLITHGVKHEATSALCTFLDNSIDFATFKSDKRYLEAFVLMDDYDVWGAIKYWTQSKDRVLSLLSTNLLNRRLFKVIISNAEFPQEKTRHLSDAIMKKMDVKENEVQYLLVRGILTNAAYQSGNHTINILTKSGEIIDIAQASDLPNIKALSGIVKKHYVCYPKGLNF